MQEIKNQAQALVDKYNDQLAAFGIRVALSKKYFESAVPTRSTYSFYAAVSLLNHIDAHFDRKREEKKYKHERNKYHCLVLSVLPIDKKAVHRDHCKDYAFVLRKLERAHIGDEPQRVVYEEHKILKKIEKRLQKTLKKAQKAGIMSACKNTFLDVLRYCTLQSYAYKKRIHGKDRLFWDMIVIASVVLLAILLVLFLNMIGNAP